ncbi:MAG: EAL domain-containing protein [Campylobacteraceae bacterium]|nr:EAL domain-containing protein [Campylobacteraceae bacterium]
MKKYNIFKKIYSIGNGKFAILSNFFDFEKSKFTLEEYFNTFVKNINKEILEIDGTSYDLNILLSYSFGKYKLFEDTFHGLEEAIADNKTVHNSNDASLRDERKELDNKITQMVQIALDNYKIIPYFQAIVNNKTKKIEKYESLVRLIDENNKVVSPFYFLNVSKKSGYYSKITHRVLENSFKIASQIKTTISINLSVLDIEKEATRKLIYSLLIKYSEYTSNIIFELLEDEAAKDDKLIKNFIKKVKRTGIKIALDDFGSGYSSFERVLLYEPDIIKIDGSLVKNIESSESSRHLVETIVIFAKKQNIVTIAEYVENENIFNILRDIGVDYSQGYYFGKPEDLFYK